MYLKCNCLYTHLYNQKQTYHKHKVSYKNHIFDASHAQLQFSFFRHFVNFILEDTTYNSKMATVARTLREILLLVSPDGGSAYQF